MMADYPLSIASTRSSSTAQISIVLQELANEYRKKFNDDELKGIISIKDAEQSLRDWRLELGPASKTAHQQSEVDIGVERYSALFVAVAAVSPDLGNLLWEVTDLLRKRSRLNTWVKQNMEVIFHEFCCLAPRLQTYSLVFAELEDSRSLQNAVLDVYRAVLEFFFETNQWIKKSNTGLRIAPKLSPDHVHHRVKQIERAKKALEAEVNVASLELHREWQQQIKEMLANAPSQATASLPCHSIPYPSNQRFTGRGDLLAQMRQNLSGKSSGQSSFALHGTGGVGKTQIALKYIHDYLDEFEAVFWLTADSRAKLSQSYVDSAKKLGIEPTKSQRDQETVVESFKSWLGETTASWLLVYDNADDLRLLKLFWPPSKTGTIIITSRDSAASVMANSGALVSSMSKSEGFDLFMSIFGSNRMAVDDEIERKKIDEIIKLLGFLPLAISQVAAFMVERECSVEDFLEIYNESLQDEQTFGGLDTDSPNLFYEHSLATVWRISLDRLSPESTTLLSILSYLDPDGVPETMIRQSAQVSKTFKFLSSASTYTKVTKELLRNGLIWKLNKQQGNIGGDAGTQQVRSVSLHRLVQETVFHQQNTDGRNDTFAKAVEICLRAFPHPTRSNFRLMHRWPECEQYLPHLLMLNARCENSSDLVPDASLAELFLYAGWYLYERRAPEVAIPLLNTAYKICNRPGSDVDWFLKSRILSAFGCVLFECSRYRESEQYFRDALAVRLENVLPDDILLAHGYQDIALPLSGQGRYQEALSLQEQALGIIKMNKDDFTRRDMSFHVHHNMGRTLEASGNAQRALELHFAQGDEFGSGIRTEMSESGAVNLYAIGNCHLLLGNQSKGIAYHYRALRIRRNIVGDKGFYYGISLHKIGTILYASGAYQDALEALNAAEKIFAGAHDAQREHSRTLYHLSILERKLDRFESANKHFDTAWTLRTDLTGVQRPEGVTAPENSTDEVNGFDDLVIYIHA